jgi:hypothetical protein
MIGLGSKFLLVLVASAFSLLSMIPFQFQSVDGSLTPSTNQSGDSNTTNSSAPLSNILIDTNQTLSPFTAGLHQNSTRENSINSSLPVKDSNATNQSQKQDLISSYIQQHQPSSGTDIQSQQNQQLSQSYTPPPAQQQQLQQQQPLSQSQPQPPSQSYTYTPSPMQQPLQQQPYSQPYPPPASPSYTIPYNPSLTQPTDVPPRILSDNNYVDNIGTLHIVGEVINESYQSVSYVRITATFYDSNNSVIGTDFTFTSPSTLQPGQRAPFDLTISEGSVPTYLMAYYTLSVD